MSRPSSQTNFVHRHSFNVSEDAPGGERLLIRTDFFSNGDAGSIFSTNEIRLNSYTNSASIFLGSIALTPEVLRKLADEIEEAEVVAREMIERTV